MHIIMYFKLLPHRDQLGRESLSSARFRKIIINCCVCPVHVFMSLRLRKHSCSVKRVKCCLGIKAIKATQKQCIISLQPYIVRWWKIVMNP